MKEHPPATAEHFNVSVAGVWKPCDDCITQSFLAAYPRHKTVHSDPFQDRIAKRKGRSAFLLQNDLITVYLFSVDLKEAHREYAYDAADKQTDKEGQHIVIPPSS